MGFGLILAGMGKGIAEAGSTYGSMTLKDWELKRQYELENLRAANAEHRDEMRDKLKQAALDAQARKDAGIVAQAQTNAPPIGDQRRFDQFKKDVGETALSEDQLRDVFNKQYNQREVGDFEGADRYKERLSKAKADVLSEISRLGGSPTAIKEAREELKLQQDQEWKDVQQKIQTRREDRRDQQAADTARYQASMAGAAATRAAAAETRANRDLRDPSNRPATTADMQRQINATRDEIATELGSSKADLNTAIASTKRKAAAGDAKAKEKLASIQPYLDELEELSKQMKQFKRPPAEPAAPPAAAPTPGASTRPPLSSFKK